MLPAAELHGVGVKRWPTPCLRTPGSRWRANRQLYAQEFSRGITQGPLQTLGAAPNRRGTTVVFTPGHRDFRRPQISAPSGCSSLLDPRPICFAGVEIRWKCAASLTSDDVPAEAVFQVPRGLADHLAEQIGARECVTAQPFAGMQEFPQADGTGQGRAEWAIAWPLYSDGFDQLVLQHRAHTGTAAPTNRACEWR